MLCSCSAPAAPGRAACQRCIDIVSPIDYVFGAPPLREARPRPGSTTHPVASSSLNWLSWVALAPAGVAALMTLVGRAASPGILAIAAVAAGAAMWAHLARRSDAAVATWTASGLTLACLVAAVMWWLWVPLL